MSATAANGELSPSLFGKVIHVRVQVILRRGKGYETVGNSIVKVEFTHSPTGAYGCFLCSAEVA